MIKVVGIVGGGIMGSGIAEVVARSGCDVVLREVDEAAVEGAQARLAASLDRAVRNGKLAAGERNAIFDRVRFTDTLDDLSECDLVAEAAIEDEDAKTAIFAALGKVVRPDALLTINTAKDRAGFVVNALLIPYLLAAIRMVDAGLASAEDIDTAMVAGCAHPMGPLALADLIGLDTTAAVAVSMYEETKEQLYAPPALLLRKVEAGELGRKTGGLLPVSL